VNEFKELRMAPSGVAVGRTIHYGPQNHELRPGSVAPHIPGMIVKVWDADRGYINAVIFPDGGNDLADGTLIQWRTSIEYDETGTAGTWHFPERI
jgi:hypothetical protein